jgi:heterogeneous nuclear rnp K-like protein 2
MSSPSASGATKRPLEDSSSPNIKDEHDSKRPALDKEVKGGDSNDSAPSSPSPVRAEVAVVPATKAEPEAGEVKKDGDTDVPDAPTGADAQSADAQSVDTQNQQAVPQVDESNWIHMRAVITSAEAATVIGKGGENVTQIRRMAEAKCTVSDYQRGAGERILTVSGAVDAVAKVCSQFWGLN